MFVLSAALLVAAVLLWELSFGGGFPGAVVQGLEAYGSFVVVDGLGVQGVVLHLVLLLCL